MQLHHDRWQYFLLIIWWTHSLFSRIIFFAMSFFYWRKKMISALMNFIRLLRFFPANRFFVASNRIVLEYSLLSKNIKLIKSIVFVVIILYVWHINIQVYTLSMNLLYAVIYINCCVFFNSCWNKCNSC